MTEEEGLKLFSDENFKMKMMRETAEAFLCRDEEILEALPLEEAQEFIAMRNEVVAEWERRLRLKKQRNDEPATPLAAEDSAEYKQP